MSIYTTGNGQRAKVTLPDGSTAFLNVASRLQVPADYGMGNHVVHLDGEAFFTVVHHDKHPLTVVAGSARALVLGTQFVVRHYHTDSLATVAVREGKVGVQKVVLSAAQQVAVNRAGVTTAVRPVDPAQFGFTRGVLRFNGTALRDAIPALNRWYDADIRLGDPALAEQRVIGGFTSGSRGNLAELLQLAFNVRVVRHGRVLTLYPN
jgi:ferric-dicitrate binding protein FerR (iron transport regulator)